MLIILDRDGVINEYDGNYICSADEWHPIPGSVEAVARLCNAGHRIAIATNQSGIGRGSAPITTSRALVPRFTWPFTPAVRPARWISTAG